MSSVEGTGNYSAYDRADHLDCALVLSGGIADGNETMEIHFTMVSIQTKQRFHVSVKHNLIKQLERLKEDS